VDTENPQKYEDTPGKQRPSTVNGLSKLGNLPNINLFFYAF
jgi:hypothetical protein